MRQTTFDSKVTFAWHRIDHTTTQTRWPALCGFRRDCWWPRRGQRLPIACSEHPFCLSNKDAPYRFCRRSRRSLGPFHRNPHPRNPTRTTTTTAKKRRRASTTTSSSRVHASCRRSGHGTAKMRTGHQPTSPRRRLGKVIGLARVTGKHVILCLLR